MPRTVDGWSPPCLFQSHACRNKLHLQSAGLAANLHFCLEEFAAVRVVDSLLLRLCLARVVIKPDDRLTLYSK